MAVTPVTPTCLPSIERSSSWSPLSHPSPLQNEGTCTELKGHDCPPSYAPKLSLLVTRQASPGP